MVHNNLRWMISLLIIAILIGSLSIPTQTSQAAPVSGGNCRFGLTAVYPLTGIDMTPLQAGAFLDWGAKAPRANVPAFMEYIHVLRVGEYCYNPVTKEHILCAVNKQTPYQTTVAQVNPKDPSQSIILANPGDFWIIGNEPDTIYESQDDLVAEVYADRFFSLATIIRHLDPTAKIGFGTIVQPTSIRLRYLEKAWDRLVIRAGSVQAASSLIDVWITHGFIMNEMVNQWGTGVPPGFENDHADAIHITDMSDTYSPSIFTTRIKKFRQWMKEKGEQNKPLWITEFGSYLPPITRPSDNFYTVPDAVSLQYMIKTFDFMMDAADPSIGMPLDKNHLVQSWFWYSLNDHRYSFGGSLFNIDLTDSQGNPLPPSLTQIGTAYLNYVPKSNIYNEFLFTENPSVSIDPVDHSHFKIDFRVANIGTASRQAARVWLYRDQPSGTPLAVLDTGIFQGCADSISYSGYINYPESALGFSQLYLRLDKDGDGTPHSDDVIVMLDAPPAVSGLTAVPRSRTRVRLDWTGSPNAEGFRIERSSDGGTTWSLLTSVQADTFIDTGLTCNKAYQYRVRAYQGSIDWQYSNIATTTTDVCNTPTISAQAMSQRRINLAWVNILATANGFRIQRLNSSTWEDVGTALGNASGYSDYPLVCAQSNSYRVQPLNSNDGVEDNWPYSNTVIVSTNPCGPPPQPVGLVAISRTSHSITLTWTQLDDADTYHIERSPNGAVGWVSILDFPLSQDITRFVDSHLDPGSTYYYRVYATNSLGNSLISELISAKPYLRDLFFPGVMP
jgi:hypothetical protein